MQKCVLNKKHFFNSAQFVQSGQLYICNGTKMSLNGYLSQTDK